eukprot:356174-Chlamydomonas_euryale.AAC.7
MPGLLLSAWQLPLFVLGAATDGRVDLARAQSRPEWPPAASPACRGRGRVRGGARLSRDRACVRPWLLEKEGADHSPLAPGCGAVEPVLQIDDLGNAKQGPLNQGC